jgi:hypothetical protein
MKITTMGIELAKNIFRVHACDERGRCMPRQEKLC